MTILIPQVLRILASEPGTDADKLRAVLECDGDIWHLVTMFRLLGWGYDRFAAALNDPDFVAEYGDEVRERMRLPERPHAATTVSDLSIYASGWIERDSGKMVVYARPNKSMPAESAIDALALLIADARFHGGEVIMSLVGDELYKDGAIQAAEELAAQYGFNQTPTTVFFKQYRTEAER